jgi:TRAP-type C4-dicarboxylate transport system substrate-binding protein
MGARAMRNRNLFLATAIAATALGAVATSAQTIEWRFNNNYAPTRPESNHIRELAADIEARTDGALEVSVSEGGAMGLADADALRYMTVGTPEMAFIWPPFLGRDAPDIANIYVFGLISGAEEHMQALPAVKAVLEEGIEERGIEVVGFMGLSIIDASIFCSEPVRTLDELREVKLRVGTREQVETFSRLGVAAQIVPQNELYTALQTGVVDCALYPARFAGSISVQEVAQHATPIGFPFPPAPYAMMVNADAWAELPEDLKGHVTDAMVALEERSFDFASDAEAEAAAREETGNQGVTWYPEFSEEDRQEIRDAALETWAELAEDAGGNAPDYRQRVLDALQ